MLLPAPALLAKYLSLYGLKVELSVSRGDGAAVQEYDCAAVAAVVATLDRAEVQEETEAAMSARLSLNGAPARR